EGLAYDQIPIHLQKDVHKAPEYRAKNPHMRVPALALAGGEILTQSLAICEYLDETHSDPPLLPADPIQRAQVRAVALLIACDIHPLNNLGTLRYLKEPLKHDQPAIDEWYHHWILAGFRGLEVLLKPGPYALGSQVTLADVCLVPQVFNARRLKVPLDAFPKIGAVDRACNKLAAFAQEIGRAP